MTTLEIELATAKTDADRAAALRKHWIASKAFQFRVFHWDAAKLSRDERLALTLDGTVLDFPGDKYIEVATVAVDDLDDAYRATNHIDSDWLQNPEVVDAKTTKARSSSVGDVFVDVKTGEAWRVVAIGFEKIVGAPMKAGAAMETAKRALQVFTLCPAMLAWLEANDPKALGQARDAIAVLARSIPAADLVADRVAKLEGVLRILGGKIEKALAK